MRNVHIYISVNHETDQLTLEKVGVVLFAAAHYVGVACLVLLGRHLALVGLERSGSLALEGGLGAVHLVAVEAKGLSSGLVSLVGDLTGSRRSGGKQERFV